MTAPVNVPSVPVTFVIFQIRNVVNHHNGVVLVRGRGDSKLCIGLLTATPLDVSSAN